LLLFTNILTTILGLIAYVMYVVVYGIAKRTTIHSTLIGTIPGALPPAAGYIAVTGVFDMAALLLFVMMLFWQMPHFYAIAIFRRSDYQAAGLPIWSVIKGTQSTKLQILMYAILFAVTAPLLSIYGYTGFIYAIVMTIIGLIWVVRGLRGFRAETDEKWARRMFFFSLNVLLVMCLMIMLGGYLP
jgi:protoheme IX farnesyltransferase